MKKENKQKRNKWKIAAIVSIAINVIIAIFLTIGLSMPSKASIKVSALDTNYNVNNIITSTNKIRSDIDYKLYFDWEKNAYDVNDLNNTDFHFVICDNVPTFAVRFNNADITIGDYALYLFLVYHAGSEIRFTGFFTKNGTYFGFRDLYSIGTEANFINKVSYTGDEFLATHDFYTPFRELFNGSISINSGFSYDNYTLDYTFLKTYFSQYSVQNLNVTKNEYTIPRLKNIDWSIYSWNTQPASGASWQFMWGLPLIYSDIPLFGGNSNIVGNAIALEGLFNYRAESPYNWANKLYFTFKWLDANQWLEPVYYEGYEIPKTGGYYYYLDSLTTDMSETLFQFYQVNVNWDTGIYYSLAMPQQDLNTLPLVINKINCYPNQVNLWNNFSYIFTITNYFEWNNGNPNNPIINPPDSPITDNTTIGDAFSLIRLAFESLIPMLSIMVLPGISLGILIFIPIILTVIIVVIKLVKR